MDENQVTISQKSIVDMEPGELMAKVREEDGGGAKTLLFEALGEVSMCWEPRPEGVFDSSRVEKIGAQLYATFSTLMENERIKSKGLEEALNETLKEAEETVSMAAGESTRLVLRDLWHALVRIPSFKKVQIFLPKPLMKRVSEAAAKPK